MSFTTTPAVFMRGEHRPRAFVGLVAPPREAAATSGERITADAMDLTARLISSRVPHQALPLTTTLCLAVAARLDGSVVAHASGTDGLRMGILSADAAVERDGGMFHATRGSFFRTARPLMRRSVFA